MRAVAIAVLLLFASEPRAEIPAHYVDRTPTQAARDAFDTEYGGVLVAELGKILRESADPACRRARALDDATLEARGRELLVRNGARYLEILTGLIDAAKFEAAVAARAGANAKADYAALRKDPEIRKYLELGDAGKLARLADRITEAIDQHGLLAQVKLKRQLSPMSTGSKALMDASPEEKSFEEAERFLESRKSARTQRWLQLEEALVEAADVATDRETFLRMGPQDMTPEVPADFAALCVFSGR